MRIWSVIAIACLLPAPAAADIQAEALAHAKAFEKAMSEQDVAGALALYADNARVVFPGEGETATGKAEIERLLRKTIEGLQGAKLTLQSQEVVPFAGGIAIVGRWQMELTDDDGATETIDLRRTEVLSKLGERTVSVVDHLSVGVPPGDEPAETPGTSETPDTPVPGVGGSFRPAQ